MINREKTFLSGDMCVYNVQCQALKYFFPRMVFSSVLRVVQLWWPPLVNTDLISKFQENISSSSLVSEISTWHVCL